VKLKLFSTQRQIREWLKDRDNSILDKHFTIGEFLGNIVVVEGKKFIDGDLRKIYLFEAIKNIDVEKLGVGKRFLTFFEDSEFIFGFLKELFIEKVDIDNVIMSDTYIEYEEHLNIIKQIKDNYSSILAQDGYIDTFLIDKYSINSGLLEGIEEIEIYLDGYLSKFDLEVLSKIPRRIVVTFNVSKFNKSLIKKMFGEFEEGYRYSIELHSKEILSQKKIKNIPQVEVSYFSKKFDEVNFIFAKIAEFVEEGLDPDKIVVILPDESFSSYLMEFDKFKNLNFAMGRSFKDSNIYIKLEALYNFLLNGDEISKEKLQSFDCQDDFIECIKKNATDEELRVIDEELFKIEKFKNIFKDNKQFLHFILNRFKNLTFDDKYSGRITTMGVLESRGMEYDGVIITNFNDGVVPNVNSKDLFLNSSIRKKAELPTRMDKENLQKHYYYNLIKNSKKVAISYVKNEKESVSRFLYELGFDEGKNRDLKYREVLYRYSLPTNVTEYEEKFDVKYPISPTSLKMLLECPKRYYLRKILNIQPPKSGENFGDVFHRALEKTIKNKEKLSSFEEYYEDVFNNIYQTLNSYKDIYDIRIKYENGIKKFCEIDFDRMKYSFNMVEKGVEFEFNGKKLYAKIDRVDITDTEVRVIDYKTGDISKVLTHPYDFQLTFYYLWAKATYPDKKVVVAYYDIKNAEYIEAPIKIDELKDVLDSLPNISTKAKDIKTEKKSIKWIDICRWCEYNIACGRD
jgi:RecB family exonuclease